MAKLHLVVVMEDGDTEDSMKKIKEGGDPLLSLCRKTVETFSDVLKKTPGFHEGAATWEKRFGEGLLYQLARGHLYAEDKPASAPGAPNLDTGV